MATGIKESNEKQVTGTEPTVENVSAEQVHEWLTNGEAVLVDVREPMEHQRESIPGSELVPAGEINQESVREIRKGTDRRLVFHCNSGNRSMNACRSIKSVVDGTVYNLEGGIQAWKDAGYDTNVDESAPISLQRQVQITAGTLVVAGTMGGLFSDWFLTLPLFVGSGLVFAGVTGFCGMARLLSRMPWNQVQEQVDS
jgi:rhodanese-related sulfurtransferase